MQKVPDDGNGWIKQRIKYNVMSLEMLLCWESDSILSADYFFYNWNYEQNFDRK